VGYLIVPDDDFGERLLHHVVSERAGWPIGGLVCTALPDLLDTVDLATWHEDLGQHRDQTATALRGYGFDVIGGGPTWLLIRGAHLRDALASHRIIVRDCAPFGLSDTIRLGLPAPRALADVLDAFAAVASSTRP